MPESRTIGRVDLIDAITPHAEPDRACIRYRDNSGRWRLGWLYDAKQVTDALAAFKDNRLPQRVYRTLNKKGAPYTIENGSHVGLVLHRDGLVRVFAFDLDDHGEGSNTYTADAICRLLGAHPVTFTSRGGHGLHLFFRLAEPVAIEHFLAWAKAWGFNRKGGIEVFPKTEKETQIALPGEPNDNGGDRYLSGDFNTWFVRSLPKPPGFRAAVPTLLFLAGATPAGARNDELNRSAYDLGKRGIDRETAWKWCRAACERNGIWNEDRDGCERTFESGYSDGAGVAVERAAAIFGEEAEYEPGQRDANGTLILDPMRTMPTAEAYIREHHTHAGHRTIVCHAGQLYTWTGSHYRVVEDDAIRARLFPWMHDAARVVTNSRTGDKKLVPFNANPTTVNAALQTIAARAHISDTTPVGAFLAPRDGDPSPASLLAHKGGLLDLETGASIEPTPRLFNTSALPFAYDPNAPRPKRWLAFLEEVFSDSSGETVDEVAIDLLQQWFGYCLTPDTSQQKMLLIVGPKRSGKGTISKVLTALIGAENKAGPTVRGLSTPFGLADLIGKSLAIVADARFSGPEMVGVTEQLLNISGEDEITIQRKFLGGVTMRLPTRFVFLTNEMPSLKDASTALAGRFIPLQMERSFYNQEDTGLADKLLAELPGILLWAIEGWRKLRRAGKFELSVAQWEAIEEIEELASPVSVFINDCCIVDSEARVYTQRLYDRFKGWCEHEGRTFVVNSANFGKELRACCPSVKARRDADMTRFYQGIRLKGEM